MTKMADTILLTNKGRRATDGLTCDKKTFVRGKYPDSLEVYPGFYSTKQIEVSPFPPEVMLVNLSVASRMKMRQNEAQLEQSDLLKNTKQ